MMRKHQTGTLFLILTGFLVVNAPRFIRASSPPSNTELVQHLKEKGIVKSNRVEEAMLRVDRKNYVRPNSGVNAYSDSPQNIGYGVTISAPHMHGMCLELLSNHLQPGMRALDVGSGSGYLTAAMAHMVGSEGKVYGLEHQSELIDWSKENINKDSPAFLKSGVLEIRGGDGWKGLPEEAPFDAIHVGAAAAKLPQALVDQLKPGGRMVIPVGEHWDQHLFQVDKKMDGSITRKSITSVRYVPLVQNDV